MGAGLVGETLCAGRSTSRVKRTKRRPGVGSWPSLVAGQATEVTLAAVVAVLSRPSAGTTLAFE